MKVKFLLFVSLLSTSVTAQVEHAPTVEQCQADQRLWISKIEGPAGERPNWDTLADWEKESDDCQKVDPTNRFKYYNLGAEIDAERMLRLLHFVNRHNLYEQFIAEDEAKKR